MFFQTLLCASAAEGDAAPRCDCERSEPDAGYERIRTMPGIATSRSNAEGIESAEVNAGEESVGLTRSGTLTLTRSATLRQLGEGIQKFGPEPLPDPNVTEIGTFAAAMEFFTFAVRRPLARSFNRLRINNPQLHELMIEEITSESSVSINLSCDVYNMYFMTLFKKQADGKRVPVSFPGFWTNPTWGGWPMKTFLLQVVSLSLVGQGAVKNMAFPHLGVLTWCMQLVMMSFSRLLGEFFFRDLTYMEHYLLKMMGMKGTAPGAFMWLDDDRQLACKRLIQVKMVVMISLFLCVETVILCTSDTVAMLKAMVSVHFVEAQATVVYIVLKAADIQRQLGDEQSLYAGIGEYCMTISFLARDRRVGHNAETFGGQAWRFMNNFHTACLMFALSRCPLLHPYTWGLLFGK